MTRLIAIAALLALTACASLPERIVTKEVKIMVPIQCAPKIAQPEDQAPSAKLARSREELRTMLATAPNVTEKARIVSDQLLLWLGYGPQLEAAQQACAQSIKQ